MARLVNNKVLLLIDDRDGSQNVRQQLRHISLTTVSGAERALLTVNSEGPFAVFICYLQTARVDEIDVLRAMQRVAPDVVRVIVTADDRPQAVLEAVNVAGVFRFLRGPCSPGVLRDAVQHALEHYQRCEADRRQQRETLTGTIEALIENLSIVNYPAAQRAARVRQLVRKIATECDPHHAAEYELAALLSQVGSVGVPQETIERLCDGVPLSPREQRLIAQHPAIGARILANIPRLKRIAEIVALQDAPFRGGNATVGSESTALPPGAAILRLALDVDILIRKGISPRNIAAALHRHAWVYDPAVIAAFERAFHVDDCCRVAKAASQEDSERMRRKVIKMLRLAVDSAATDSEAANARRKAEQLVKRHHLSTASLLK